MYAGEGLTFNSFIKLIESYLSDRKQYVNILSDISDGDISKP